MNLAMFWNVDGHRALGLAGETPAANSARTLPGDRHARVLQFRGDHPSPYRRTALS